ncbi:hypothetical protein GDO78_003752, partial [Eleutherodactylus coqui]
MGFADLLDRTGGMGRFQITQVALLCIPILLMASHNLLQNFTAAIPNHWCKINDTEILNSSKEGWVSLFSPLDNDGRPQPCLEFVEIQWRPAGYNVTAHNSTDAATRSCTMGWEYDREDYTSTIITQWDLVCGNKNRRQLAQSLYMAGVLVGAIILGGLSDKYGRRSLLIWSYLQMTISGICTAFSPNYLSYCVFRFLGGIALSGIGLNTTALIVEWVPTKVRTITGTLAGYSYTVGQLVLAGLAYGMRDWRWLQFTVSAPFFVIFLYSWFSTSFSYYGLAMDLQKFGVSIYLIQVIFGAVDFPAKLISTTSMIYIGRRVTQFFSLILGGLAIMANIFVPSELQTLRTSLAVFGKGCLAASFSCVFLYTTELYPTVVRQSGLGWCSTMARVGGIVAPLVKMLGEFYPFLPLLIYGGSPIISGLIVYFLPETVNQPLPDTIDEVEI